MSLASITARGRVAAGIRMDSVAQFFVESGRGTLNPTTGIETPTYTTVALDVPIRFSASADSVAGSTTSPAMSLGSSLTREVSVPVDTVDIPVGAFFELTTVGALTDPTLDGLRFRVVDPGQTSQATARRMTVEVDL